MSILKYSKIRDVKDPIYSTTDSAGIDFFIPNDSQEHIINPNESILIPSGIKVNLMDGYCMIALNKSGIVTKKHLVVGACVHKTLNVLTNKGIFNVTTLTKDFVEKNNIKILSYDIEKNEYVHESFDGFRISKKINCLKVTFEDDSEIIISEDHQMLNENNHYETFLNSKLKSIKQAPKIHINKNTIYGESM